MRFYSASLLLLGASVASTNAFAPQTRNANTPVRSSPLYASEPQHENNVIDTLESIDATVKGALSGMALAAALWVAPATMAGPMTSHFPSVSDNNVIASSVASAKEMASGSGTRVNKDPESLLRYGLPINNKEVRQLQKSIEDIRINIQSKRKAAALDDLKKARGVINTKEAKMTASCRDAKVCSDILASMKEKLEPLEGSLKASADYLNGSDQERDALDKSYATQDKIQKELTVLEEQMIPAGYEVPVPDDYNDLPQLKGRATVEMVVKKADGEQFDIEGKLYKEANMKMIIDGYSSPVTGGNFVDLVKKGFYDNMDIQRSDGFVVQTGDPKGEAEGYVGTPSKSVGAGKHGERLIPLETFVKGDKGPFYESSIEDEGRGGEATVLPFSSYGAMGWAREEYEANTGSSQFFWLLFDSDLTPAGKNVLDGRYPCFGYVVEGADFLRDTKEGDIIVSAKVTEGVENLVQPK
mmetsp:Transcript_12868/g.27323  ORF Transcript_12868/g.27323 Transcript_12868/m.27323 type:complete len:470 (+) Transcript_12868:181-1590(+)|eukprot:CAMPEP_0183703764 /NCGR_PEP_ID=MMETSP0737-20130205/1382_1 /TAXON_ID=385413 /ORGANISM="Thalassiosira miniscula, Strain CCMP1093" /LENGTH=469 /DNA_ID=CAMNT_0025930561 /DNA_START=107 /DNA_END=1516 /DNA_ORIENTATION=-